MSSAIDSFGAELYSEKIGISTLSGSSDLRVG